MRLPWDVSLYNSDSICIDDIIPRWHNHRIGCDFAGKLYLVPLSDDLVKKALNANKQNLAKGSFLYDAHAKPSQRTMAN
jgi:hypothetical protein